MLGLPRGHGGGGQMVDPGMEQSFFGSTVYNWGGVIEWSATVSARSA